VEQSKFAWGDSRELHIRKIDMKWFLVRAALAIANTFIVLEIIDRFGVFPAVIELFLFIVLVVAITLFFKRKRQGNK
jgi:hypothetical protein